MQQEIKINGVTIKRPNSFKISRYKITKAQRLSSGLMSMAIIAKKRKFFFKYTAITSKDKEHILNLIWENDNPFFVLSYIEDNVRKNATVYVGEVPTAQNRTGNATWVWTDFSFDLIER